MDIMLDLETLGTKPGCVVLSIGAKVFEPYSGAPSSPPLPSFYRNIDLFSSLMLGLTIDTGTVDWWRKQGKEAQEAFREGKVTPRQAVEHFEEWYSAINQMRAPSDIIKIWAKSPGFDCHVLEHVANLVSAVPLPWDFRCFRDVRTAIGMSKIDEKAIAANQINKIAHNALDDCDTQILQVQAAHRQLKNEIPLLPTAGYPPISPMPGASAVRKQLTQGNE